jgi:hypothetical protein
MPPTAVASLSTLSAASATGDDARGAESADCGDDAGDHLDGAEGGALVGGEEVFAGDGVVDVVGHFDGRSDGSGGARNGRDQARDGRHDGAGGGCAGFGSEDDWDGGAGGSGGGGQLGASQLTDAQETLPHDDADVPHPGLCGRCGWSVEAVGAVGVGAQPVDGRGGAAQR